MPLTRVLRVVFTSVIIPVLTLSCTSSQPKSDLELNVDDDEIRIAISEQVARDLMEDLVGAELECDGEVEGHFRALLEKLDRGGPRASASYQDGAEIVSGRRRAGKLDLEIRGDGQGKVEATMPWAFAECMLGRNTSIDKTLSSSIKVKVRNPDGRDFSFKLH